MNSYDKQFMTFTQRQWGHIRERSAAKYSNDGKRLLRPEIPVEFSLGEFREWVLVHLGMRKDGVGKCEYCGAPLAAAGFVPDHARALARGGRNTIDNLVFSCADDNDAKGSIAAEWYRYLLRCLEQMPEPESAIIRNRLIKSEKLASSVRSMRRMFADKSNPQTDVFSQEEGK